VIAFLPPLLKRTSQPRFASGKEALSDLFDPMFPAH
jgi:hypothetical protein